MSPKISYTDLATTILEDQLSGHIKFLGKFLQLFTEIDTDIDGIISCSEFEELYQRMNIIDIELFSKNQDHAIR